VFRFVRDGVFRTSFWLLLDGFLALGVLLAQASAASGWLYAAGFSLVLWAAVVCGAALIVQWLPRFPFTAIAGVFGTLLGMAVFIVFRIRPPTPEEIDAMYRLLAVISPPAWACQLAESVVFTNRPTPWLQLVLLLSVAALSAPAYRHLRDSFQFWTVDRDPEQEEDRDESEQVPERAARVGNIEEILQSEKTPAFAEWLGGGLVEKAAVRFLSSRDAVVAQFLLSASPHWTRAYRLACWFLLLSPVCSWLVSLMVPGLRIWVLGIGFFVGIGMMTPLFGGHWAATLTAPLGGRFCAILSLWPVSLREVRRVILRINLVRFLFALPWCLYVGAATARAVGEPIPQAVAFSVAIWLLALLLQPFALIFKYSRGTNDTNSGCLFCLGLIAYGLLAAGVTVVAAGLSFQATQSGTNTLLLGAAFAAVAVVSALGEAFYRRLYSSQQFDLLAVSGGSPEDT
jgi:hypothetical protein